MTLHTAKAVRFLLQRQPLLFRGLEGYVIVQAITTPAQSLRLSVTSEGIETPAQREALVALGSDYGQGYLFSRPLPAAELPLLLLQPERERELARAA